MQGIVTLDPLEAFRNNYSQGQVMQMVRARAAEVLATCACRCATSRRSTSAAAAPISISRCAVPTSRRSPTTPNSSASRRRELGIVDADTTLKLNKPELQVQIDRDARRRSRRSTREDIAAALRLMVGGDEEVTRFRDAGVNDDYDVQLRLSDERPQRPDDARTAATCRAATASWCGSTTS